MASAVGCDASAPSSQDTSMLASSTPPHWESMGMVSAARLWLTAVPYSASRRRSSSRLISQTSSKISRIR
jgi:hypothetical protein